VEKEEIEQHVKKNSDVNLFMKYIKCHHWWAVVCPFYI